MSTGKIIGVTVAPGIAPPAFVGSGAGVGIHAGTQAGIHAGTQAGMHVAGTVGHAVTTGLTAAAPFLAGVAVAAGAVMMTRAGMVALADLDARLEADTRAWRQVQGEARRWQDAYARLVKCNAGIVQLSTAARQLGPDAGSLPPLPVPLDPFGPGSDPTAVTVEAVERWCEAAERQLPDAADGLRRARIAQARRPLPADSPAARQAERRFAARLERLLESSKPAEAATAVAPAPPDRLVAAPGPDPQAAPDGMRAQVWDGVHQAMEELHGESAVAGWEDLLACAEQVRTATGRAELRRASNEFYAVAQRYRQARDERADQARQAATYLAVLAPATLPPAAAVVISRLEAVAAQAVPLDAQLRLDVEALLTRQAREAEARYSMAVLQHALVEQGYDAALDLTQTWPRVTVTEEGQPAGRLDWTAQGVSATFEGNGAVSLPAWARAVAGAADAAAADGLSARIQHVENAPVPAPRQLVDTVVTSGSEAYPAEDVDEPDYHDVAKRYLDGPRN